MNSINIKDAIDALNGMADGEDDDLAKMCNDAIEVIKALEGMAQEVVDSADDAGCDVSLTVVDSNAVARLSNMVYPDFPIGEEIGDDEDFGEKIDRLLEEGHKDEEIYEMLDGEEREMLVSLLRTRREQGQ